MKINILQFFRLLVYYQFFMFPCRFLMVSFAVNDCNKIKVKEKEAETGSSRNLQRQQQTDRQQEAERPEQLKESGTHGGIISPQEICSNTSNWLEIEAFSPSCG